MKVEVLCSAWYIAEIPDDFNLDDDKGLYHELMKQAGQTFPMLLSDVEAIYTTHKDGNELLFEH